MAPRRLTIVIDIPDKTWDGRPVAPAWDDPVDAADAYIHEGQRLVPPLDRPTVVSARWGIDGPVVVGDVGGYGCDSGEFPAVALFTTRALAEAAIADYEAAVTRAEKAGVVGVCHHGDYVIADHLATDVLSLRNLLDEHLYLLDYWPAP